MSRISISFSDMENKIVNLFRGRINMHLQERWGLITKQFKKYISLIIISKVLNKDEGKGDLQSNSFYSTPISNRHDTVSIMIATCLQYRWFCNCGTVVFWVQLPGLIGAKHIYLGHSPGRRATVLRSCYVMFIMFQLSVLYKNCQE